MPNLTALRRTVTRAALLCALVAAAQHKSQAQFTLQTSGSTASLRGIHAVTPEIAWASGSSRTILHTTSGGTTWLRCATPPDAENLDFRGIQAFDATTAIVMSSGKGDLSRLYKTTDACKTWKLLLTNPDAEGFWDAIVATPQSSFLIGDPVRGRFVLYVSRDSALDQWERFGETTNMFHFPYAPATDEALFAASNSLLEADPARTVAFVTGGPRGSRFYLGLWIEKTQIGHIGASYFEATLPLAKGSAAGAFSLASVGDIRKGRHYVVVGGDYTKPAESSGTAVYSTNGGQNFKPSRSTPHGYRSAVVYSAPTKSWITVGPNGTDISTDDGRNWRPLIPAPTDAPDADKNWNALSLPFVVGSKGRIGKLNPAALPAAKP
jgi:photosystem II stability/assembly factor-like uncharacterized protein